MLENRVCGEITETDAGPQIILIEIYLLRVLPPSAFTMMNNYYYPTDPYPL